MKARGSIGKPISVPIVPNKSEGIFSFSFSKTKFLPAPNPHKIIADQKDQITFQHQCEITKTDDSNLKNLFGIVDSKQNNEKLAEVSQDLS